MPDGKSPATKADIALLNAHMEAEFATKDGIARLAKEIVKNSADIREIKATMSTKDDISRIMDAIDRFAARQETFARESFTLPATLDEHGKRLRGHEARLAEHDRRLKAVEARP